MMMLRFSEEERPSFIELGKQILTSADNTLESQKEEKKTDRDLKTNKLNTNSTAKVLKESTEKLAPQEI